MNHVYLNQAETTEWEILAARLKAASQQLLELDVSLRISLSTSREELKPGLLKVFDHVQKAHEEMTGLSYMCTPQSEWTGNDAKGNYTGKVRSPHICNSP